MIWLILLGALGLWILIGQLILFWGTHTPSIGANPLVRTANRRMCLEGDTFLVTLYPCDKGLPRLSNQEVTPWDITLVMDHSISMGSGIGSPLLEAKQAAINLVNTTPDSFRYAIVEFDHGAREICPLAQKGRGIIRALKSINAGGSTDIALGLKVGGQAMRNSAQSSDRKRCLILLSDGGSSEAPAIAEAEAIKKLDPDLILITIGIGAADMSLLRKIASTPDYCFQADKLEELGELYMQIGTMMAENMLKDIRVKENLNCSGCWGLRSWSEIKPVQSNILKGQFLWYMAALEQKPVELGYTLEALCPGWHRIALKPAELTGQLTDDTKFIKKSNGSPRMLVLPRVAGWQFLYLVLNPLFFMLFSRFFCRKKDIPIRSKNIPVTPTPLKNPPVLEPAGTTVLEPAGTTQGPLLIRPTLVLGLGYGGTHAMIHCKRSLWERGEKRVDLDQVCFCALDSAGEEYFKNPEIGTVTVALDERIHLDVPLEPMLAKSAKLTSNKYPWLSANYLQAGAARPDLQRGTEHQRALGRMAMMANRSKIQKTLQPVLEDLIKKAEDNSVDVLITGTTGGGVSSGGILELCWLVKCLAENVGGKASNMLFLMSPIAKNKSMDMTSEEIELRKRNSQALFLEIDRLAALRNEKIAPTPKNKAIRHWFDRVFCVGPGGVSHQEAWSAHGQLYPKGGDVLFSWIASESFRKFFTNLDAENARLTQTYNHCGYPLKAGYFQDFLCG